MVRFSFCGHELMALPQGALFWPARRALLVADLHLEKASWFARAGRCCRPTIRSRRSPTSPLIAAATAAAEIWCLGDSFHDRHGCDRLPGEARAMLTGADRRDALDLDHRQSRSRLRRSIAAARSSRRPRWTALLLRHEADPAETAARAVRPFPPQAPDQPSRPAGLAPLLRRDGEQADPPRLRLADRRARRPPSRDRPRGRRRAPRRWCRCRTGC